MGKKLFLTTFTIKTGIFDIYACFLENLKSVAYRTLLGLAIPNLTFC